MGFVQQYTCHQGNMPVPLDSYVNQVGKVIWIFVCNIVRLYITLKSDRLFDVTFAPDLKLIIQICAIIEIFY